MKCVICTLMAALMLSLTACGYKGGKTTDEMKEYEFLFEIMDWEKCGHDRTKTHGWYYNEEGGVEIFASMEDISAKISEDVTVEIMGIETAEGKNVLRYSVHNGREGSLNNPFEKPEIAVLLEDGWYRVPGSPACVDEDRAFYDIEPDQSAESWIGLGNEYTELLPAGKYRIMLGLMDQYEVGEYAVAEFEIKDGK